MAKEYIPIFTGIKNKRDEKVLRKLYKKIIADRVRKESVGDPYQISLMEKPRKFAKLYDGYIEYGLYELDEDQKSLSDQELEELVYDEYAIPEWHSQYDCTGRPFTEFISFHRNPCGLVQSFIISVTTFNCGFISALQLGGVGALEQGNN